MLKHFLVVFALGVIAFILYRTVLAYTKTTGLNAGVK